MRPVANVTDGNLVMQVSACTAAEGGAPLVRVDGHPLDRPLCMTPRQAFFLGLSLLEAFEVADGQDRRLFRLLEMVLANNTRVTRDEGINHETLTNH